MGPLKFSRVIFMHLFFFKGILNGKIESAFLQPGEGTSLLTLTQTNTRHLIVLKK